MDASVTSLAYRVLFLVLSARVASESIYCDGLLGQNDVDPVLGWDYTNRCRLHAYQLDDVVECFNVMGHYIQHPLHLAFVGDSRTRQQFISFLKKVPAYDAVIDGYSRSQWDIQHDFDFQSQILNLHISFRWRPILNESLIDEFKNWVNAPDRDTPTVILLGLGVHHMLPEHNADHKTFEKRLQQLALQVQQLSKKSLVIWFHQNPVIQMFQSSDTGHFSNFITPDLVDQYNVIAKRVFRETQVFFWNSSEPLSREYIRGCSFNQRQQREKHHRCQDFVHIGYVAIHRSTHLFMNFLCNKFLNISQNPTVHLYPETCCT